MQGVELRTLCDPAGIRGVKDKADYIKDKREGHQLGIKKKKTVLYEYAFCLLKGTYVCYGVTIVNA